MEAVAGWFLLTKGEEKHLTCGRRRVGLTLRSTLMEVASSLLPATSSGGGDSGSSGPQSARNRMANEGLELGSIEMQTAAKRESQFIST